MPHGRYGSPSATDQSSALPSSSSVYDVSERHFRIFKRESTNAENWGFEELVHFSEQAIGSLGGMHCTWPLLGWINRHAHDWEEDRTVSMEKDL